ncbi:unnamed protein product, partial [marine sediment metagenome]
ISIFLPPIGGIYYFIKFFLFFDNIDAKKAGIVSLVLTIISLVLNIWILKLFLNQSIGGVVGNNQNLDMLKELITPGNQKSLQQLLQ